MINDNYKTDLTFQQRQDFFINLYKQRHEELKNIVNHNLNDFIPVINNNVNVNNNNNNIVVNNNNNIINIFNLDVFNINYLYYQKYLKSR